MFRLSNFKSNCSSQNLYNCNLPLSSDTATRSGMYCSVATTIDRCKTEGVVDVFQVVKALRVHKPGAVPSVVSSSAAYIEEACTITRARPCLGSVPTYAGCLPIQDIVKASSLCTVD